jgi:hypothetical protein
MTRCALAVFLLAAHRVAGMGDVVGRENANLVKTLRMRYDAWKKAGSKPFATVPTVGVTSSNQ